MAADAFVNEEGWGPPSRHLEELFALFRHRTVLVLGDAMLDEYLRGDVARLSPEAPVPVLRVGGVRSVLGGAANTAANVASLGGTAVLVSAAGPDEAGATLRRLCLESGIHCELVDSGMPTLRKTRVIGHQQQIVRLDYESGQALSSTTEAAVLSAVQRHVSAVDIVVVSDYAKGFLSSGVLPAIREATKRAGRLLIVDPRPQHRQYYQGCDYITPNWRESRSLLGWPEAEPTEANVRATARALADQLKTNVVLTLGPHGIWFCSLDGAEEFSTPTIARQVFDVSGAGDTVVAAFALARATGLGHREAVALANRAASVVVGKFGTATVTPSELMGRPAGPRLLARTDLPFLGASLRAAGRSIATINGAFDLLHAGHLHILHEAKKCGDVLVVGLNSDASVRGYKGAQRPLVPQDQRAEMLLALRVVDYVHIFDEPDPIAFLTELKPDVHVNGAEYGEHCVEREAVIRGGGRIHIVERRPGLSTSRLVSQLLAAEGRGDA